jgi:hypothetical protein
MFIVPLLLAPIAMLERTVPHEKQKSIKIMIYIDLIDFMAATSYRGRRPGTDELPAEQHITNE